MNIEKNKEQQKTIQTFKDLVAWKKSHALVIEIYKTTKSLPEEEKFGLISQMRRSAVSITSNIAEGFGRNTAKDKTHFYAMARGSLFELHSQLLVTRDLDFISGEKMNLFEESCVEISKIIAGLIKSTKNNNGTLSF